MQADIYNKLNGTRLSDRLEDNLTGNFFGTVRYLYPQVNLSNILDNLDSTDNDVQILNEKLKDQAPINYFFWEKGTEGEIDLLLKNQTSAIGIEVKLDSGLSSDDDSLYENDDDTESINQLAKYARMILKIEKEYRALIFVAPFDKKYIYDDVVKRSYAEINNLDFFGYISWEEIFRNIQRLKSIPHCQDAPTKIILDDLSKLLVKKGFKTFSGFYHTEKKINKDINWIFKKKKVENNNGNIR